MGRLAAAIALVALVLAGLLGSWFASGWGAVQAEQDRLRAVPRDADARDATELDHALADHLQALAQREDARPWYQYNALFHDPRGAYQGNAVAPSPLSDKPDDPLIAVYFEIARDGTVKLPAYLPGEPSLSSLSSDQAVRFQLGIASVARQLGDAAETSHVVRTEPMNTNAYLQNVNAADVYQSPNSPQPEDQTEIGTSVSSLVWVDVTFDGTPWRAAVRYTNGPEEYVTTTIQGFLIAHDAARDFLRARNPSADLGDDWKVSVRDTAALADADAQAAALPAAFLWRFVPTAALAAACGALVILMLARAERSAKQRAQFAAAAAHELRTPLAGLQLYGDMLAGGLGNPERAGDYGRRVAEEASRLGRVVSNVLDFSRLERGNLSVREREADIVPLVKDAAERARPAIERAGATLALELPEQARAQVDDDALARILGNLLDNAEKYARDAADRTITIRVVGTQIEVHDAGPGIADPRTLWKPFARGVGSDGPPGLGLGLALSRSLARAMGGELSYRAGEGATFVLALRSPAAGTGCR